MSRKKKKKRGQGAHQRGGVVRHKESCKIKSRTTNHTWEKMEHHPDDDTGLWGGKKNRGGGGEESFL